VSSSGGSPAYRGHNVRVQISDEEFNVLQAQASRTGKPMAVLLREAYFGSPRKPPAVPPEAKEPAP
jgi:hypothetical protein